MHSTLIMYALVLKYSAEKIFVMYDFVQKYFIFSELCEMIKRTQLLWVKVILDIA